MTMKKQNSHLNKPKRKLGKYEFYCSKCKKVHTKSAYAIAQTAMNVRLIFTCTCGNKIKL